MIKFLNVDNAKFCLSEISEIVHGTMLAVSDATVDQIFIDSRNQIGDSGNAMFVAIRGERHDGHKYIEELYGKGVRSFLVDSDFDCRRFAGANFVLVANTLDALQEIAAAARASFRFPTLGITGSNGKTCVKEWIYRIFKNTVKVSRSPKSYNSQTGVPLSVLMADHDSELGIFEAGISKPDEMARLEKILRPDIGIFTNIGDAHQENFRDIEHKIREKLKLFARSRLLIYCADQILPDTVIAESRRRAEVFTWGSGDDCNLRLVEKIDDGERTRLHIVINDVKLNETTGREQWFEIPFTDSASVENAMHCIAFALVQGVEPEIIRENLADISPVAMRLEVKEGVNRCTIINDSYNSDINSLTIALNFLDRSSRHKKKTVILSDILQSESDGKKLYRQVSGLLKNRGIDKFIGIGEALERNSALIADSSGIENCKFYNNTDVFLAQCNKADFNGEAVLLKGSRPFRFEKISRLLEFKIHQTILEVNTDAMIANLNCFRSKLNAGVKLMAMVKAFSYGHGGSEIASLLQYHRVDYLAVACADEGIDLRDAGITMPIVVLNPDPDNFDIMIEYRLEPEIYSLDSLDVFLKTARNVGTDNYPVHIKLDTGMHRLGLSENDVEKLCKTLNSNSQAKVISVFSHLAASDESRHDGFTSIQIEKFGALCCSIESQLGYSFLKHILNSAGIERFPDAQFDMVRLGIGLYGIGADENCKHLTPVGTLSSAIVQIKHIDCGETVGYGRHGRASVPAKIATVPIGYADGLDRKLGNGAGYFLVNGQIAPIIGNICMDSCMIDITGIDARESDRVTVMGKKPSVYEIAKTLNTIPYEILTSISQRVKRIYVSS